MIKDDYELKKVVDEKLKKATTENCLNIELSEKIFLHDDEEKRVGFPHIKSFYETITEKTLDKKEMLFFFGHYLKGKT